MDATLPKASIAIAIGAISDMSPSELEMDHSVDHHVADKQRQRDIHQSWTDQRVVADVPEVMRRNKTDDAKQHKRDRGQEPRRHPPFGRHGLDLQAQLCAAAQQLREARQYFGQIASGLTL